MAHVKLGSASKTCSPLEFYMDKNKDICRYALQLLILAAISRYVRFIIVSTA
jgi:hypothetical protein